MDLKYYVKSKYGTYINIKYIKCFKASKQDENSTIVYIIGDNSYYTIDMTIEEFINKLKSIE